MAHISSVHMPLARIHSGGHLTKGSLENIIWQHAQATDDVFYEEQAVFDAEL